MTTGRDSDQTEGGHEEQLEPESSALGQEGEVRADDHEGSWAGAERPPRTRRGILADQARQRRRNKPFVIAGLLILAGIMVIPTVNFIQKFVLPPRELAVRVEGVEYTRGDVVDFLRYRQRLVEQAGETFQRGSSLFEALQTISENEIAFQGATRLGITVDESEVDAFIRTSLGFPGVTAEDAEDPETAAKIKEALFQFLNETGLSEQTYRNIVRKDLFRQKVRDHVAQDVPRVQEQVHLFRVVLNQPDPDVTRRIRQRLKGGESIEDLAVEYSVDSQVRRNRGDEGWIPRGVIPSWDPLLFGEDEGGDPNLPTGRLSQPARVPPDLTLQSQSGQQRVGDWALVYIQERSDARRVDDAAFEVLKDRAFSNWVNEERERLDIHLVLNSDIYDWVNQQVKLASLEPSPTAAPSDFFTSNSQGDLVPQGGQ